MRASDAGDTLESLALVRVVTLKGETYHVQGVDRVGDRVYVTSVERAARKGHLFEFSYPGGDLLRHIEVQEGDRHHPGGLSIFGDFVVEDSIGCLAVDAGVLVGGNWDSREIYFWDHAGKQRDRMANPHGNAYQDLKVVSGKLVGGGLLPASAGAIDWMEFPSLRLVRRLKAGRTDRGVPFTNEGMALAGSELLLLPEDAPSRLFAFRLDAASLRLMVDAKGSRNHFSPRAYFAGTLATASISTLMPPPSPLCTVVRAGFTPLKNSA